MQTFLPFADYKKSAESLDRQRLGKQRMEVKQIFNTLRYGGGWKHHPAIRMWQGHKHHLLLYGLAMCQEWIDRGYNDTIWWEFKALLESVPNTGPPEWLGDEKVHRSHRSNLLRKLHTHYRDKLHWEDPANLPYYWPV
jgi:hypothetical protein